MFCPTCRSEYREGIIECPTCREPLVVDLPAPIPASTPRRLPKAATAAIVGTVLIFVIRTVSTLYISPSLGVARVLSTVYFLSQAALIVFFLAFLAEEVKTTQPRLRLATWAALCGCVAAAVIVGLNLLFLFDLPLVLPHQLGLASEITSMLIPFTSVFFFAAFLVEGTASPARLAQAVKLALVGAIVSAAAHGVTAVFSVFSPFSPSAMKIIFFSAGVPIVLFAVSTWLYFLWVIRLSRLGAALHT